MPCFPCGPHLTSEEAEAKEEPPLVIKSRWEFLLPPLLSGDNVKSLKNDSGWSLLFRLDFWPVGPSTHGLYLPSTKMVKGTTIPGFNTRVIGQAFVFLRQALHQAVPSLQPL